MGSVPRIVEIFSSLQGEGLYAGQRQIFLRFAGCNLICDYCDQPEALELDSGRIWDMEEVKNEIVRLSLSPSCRAVSLTGGEPLLYADYLLGILPWIRQTGLAVHLETNATLPSAFKRISGLVDVVAADVKLPSSTGKQTWHLHKRFLEFCRDAAPPPETFVKIVLTSSSTWEEWERAVEMLENVSGNIPLFIQPATPVTIRKPQSVRHPEISGRGSPTEGGAFAGGGGQPATGGLSSNMGTLSLRGSVPPEIKAADNEFVLRALNRARAALSDVRVLGQQHPVWGVK